MGALGNEIAPGIFRNIKWVVIFKIEWKLFLLFQVYELKVARLNRGRGRLKNLIRFWNICHERFIDPNFKRINPTTFNYDAPISSCLKFTVQMNIYLNNISISSSNLIIELFFFSLFCCCCYLKLGNLSCSVTFEHFESFWSWIYYNLFYNFILFVP